MNEKLPICLMTDNEIKNIKNVDKFEELKEAYIKKEKKYRNLTVEIQNIAKKLEEIMYYFL